MVLLERGRVHEPAVAVARQRVGRQCAPAPEEPAPGRRTRLEDSRIRNRRLGVVRVAVRRGRVPRHLPRQRVEGQAPVAVRGVERNRGAVGSLRLEGLQRVQVAVVLGQHAERGAARGLVRRVPFERDVGGEVARGAEGSVERPRDEVARGVQERRRDERVQVRFLVLPQRHRHEGGDVLGGERFTPERDGGKHQRERRFRERALE